MDDPMRRRVLSFHNAHCAYPKMLKMQYLWMRAKAGMELAYYCKNIGPVCPELQSSWSKTYADPLKIVSCACFMKYPSLGLRLSEYLSDMDIVMMEKIISLYMDHGLQKEYRWCELSNLTQVHIVWDEQVHV